MGVYGVRSWSGRGPLTSFAPGTRDACTTRKKKEKKKRHLFPIYSYIFLYIYSYIYFTSYVYNIYRTVKMKSKPVLAVWGRELMDDFTEIDFFFFSRDFIFLGFSIPPSYVWVSKMGMTCLWYMVNRGMSFFFAPCTHPCFVFVVFAFFSGCDALKVQRRSRKVKVMIKKSAGRGKQSATWGHR